MSVNFNATTGISISQTSEIRKSLSDAYKAVFSTEQNELNTDPETPAGQLVDSSTAVISAKDAELLYLMNMFNPLTAEGIWQDALCAVYGITRKLAQATTVNCRCYGSQGTTISLGSVVQAEFGTNRYQLTSMETAQIPARNAEITNAYTIATAVPLSSTWLAATSADATANPPRPMTPTLGDTFVIATSGEYEGKIYMWNGTSYELSTGTYVDIDFQLTETGPIQIGVGVVNTIITVIPGWDSVYNFTAGITGRYEESRSDLENRRYNSVSKNAHGTSASLEATIKEIKDVIDCKVYNNRTNSNKTIDGITLSAHSVGICVKGGEDTAIAEAIYNKLDAGCDTSTDGTAAHTDINKTVTYTDSTGIANSYTIIRPENENIVVKVEYRVLPTTKSTVQQDIINAVTNDFNGADTNSENARVGLGQTLYASRFSIPVIKTAGVTDLVSIKVGKGTTIASATEESISIAANEEPVLAMVIPVVATESE